MTAHPLGADWLGAGALGWIFIRDFLSAAMISHAHLAAGVAITILSAILYNIGFVIEKRALSGLPPVHLRRPGHLVRSLLSSPLWLWGFCAILLGLALQVLALSVVSISVVQPIFVSGIVLLLVLSHYSLGERLGRGEWIAIGTVVGALVAISLSLDTASDRASSHGALGALVAAALPTALVALIGVLGTERLERVRPHRAHLWTRGLAVAPGLMYGIAGLAIKAVSAQVQRYGLVASIPHVFSAAYLYAVAIASAGGLVLFQTALQRAQASVVVPVTNVVSSAYVITVGSIIFGEHLPSASWKLALRSVGFACVLLSVLLLAAAPSGDQALPRAGAGQPADTSLEAVEPMVPESVVPGMAAERSAVDR